jgi:hypothetical protein
MASIVENLGKELEQLDSEYAKEFAGQSRLTRDVSTLDRMIKRAQSILERVNQIPSAAQGPDLVKLRDAAAQAVELYQGERTAISRAQEVGPTFEAFSLEATNANLVFSRYARHFAGKDRATRDSALLGELVEDLKQIDKRMTALLDEQHVADFDRDRSVVRENLAQYQKEIDLIEKAQTTGTNDEQASLLASLANNQFQVYQGHFAGEPRVSRRPPLLMRVIGELRKIKDRMTGFKQAGFEAEFNERNINIVNDRLGVYESELAEVRKARQNTPMTDLMGELGTAANKLFDTYRQNFADKPRQQADLEKLGLICDKLGEIRRQMTELSWAEENDMNAKNLDIVTEQLVMFESEYEAVARAKASGK